MKLPVHAELVPSHIDGFLVQSDFRISRFSAVGESDAAEAPRAQHSRPELELNLVLHGQAQLLLGEQRIVLEPQHMLFIRPHQNRLVIDASEGFRAWVVVWKPRVLRRVCTTAASQPLTQGTSSDVLLRRLALPEARALSALFAALPVGEGRDVFNSGLGYCLARAWLAFQRAPLLKPATAAANVHPAVRKAAWLLRDGHTELSNASLAERVRLSAHRLSRLFKSQMGTSLVEFRNRQRLSRFVEQLGDGEAHNLMGLALDAGFGSYTQFHRVFQREIGCSPAEFLKRRRLSIDTLGSGREA